MDWAQIEKEVKFRTSRASGSGGQHVNKVETRVELLFVPTASEGLSASEKDRILAQLSTRLSKEGVLSVVAQNSRSQGTNRKHALERLRILLEKAITPVPQRDPVPERLVANPRQRRTSKALHSGKKALRKKIWPSDPTLD